MLSLAVKCRKSNGQFAVLRGFSAPQESGGFWRFSSRSRLIHNFHFRSRCRLWKNAGKIHKDFHRKRPKINVFRPGHTKITLLIFARVCYTVNAPNDTGEGAHNSMGELTISMNSQMDTTVVSNQFIDYYMPSANGEYVKIYLYILRSVNHHASTFSIEEMAQKFDHTVSYILNALRYWETMQLLQLHYDENNALKHITFLDLTRRKAPVISQTAARSAAQPFTARAQEGEADASAKFAAADSAAAEAQQADPYQRHTYTLDEKHRFAKDKNFNSAKFITQTYFGKPLGPSQLDILMFIYDGLGFDNDLIDYLVEYCFSKGKRSMRYIEATAIAWAKEGIHTAEQARERQAIYSQLAASVMQAFGISSRSLVPEERACLDRWSGTYRMPEELILEACRRSVRATGKPSFEYAESILASWDRQGIHTMEDVAAADEAHRRQAMAKAAQKTASGGRAVTNKKTAAGTPFPQRDYDMVSLERQLLHIGNEK